MQDQRSLTEIARAITRQIFNAESIDKRNDYGWEGTLQTAQETATREADALLTAIQQGEKLNVDLDADDETWLMRAAKLGWTKVVEALIAAGADPNVVTKPEGRCALGYAAQNDHTETVEFLLKLKTPDGQPRVNLNLRAPTQGLFEYGAPTQYLSNQYAFTLLLLAIRNGHVEVAKQLIKAGAYRGEAIIECDINTARATPLMVCLRNKGRGRARDSDLMLAKDRYECARLLIAAMSGEELYSPERNTTPPLHYLIQHGKTENDLLLIGAILDKLIIGNSIKNAWELFELALKNNRLDVVHLMLEKEVPLREKEQTKLREALEKRQAKVQADAAKADAQKAEEGEAKAGEGVAKAVKVSAGKAVAARPQEKTAKSCLDSLNQYYALTPEAPPEMPKAEVKEGAAQVLAKIEAEAKEDGGKAEEDRYEVTGDGAPEAWDLIEDIYFQPQAAQNPHQANRGDVKAKALFAAIKTKSLNDVSEACGKLTDVELSFLTDAYGRTPLIYAAQLGHTEIVCALAPKVMIHAVDGYGDTALMHVIKCLKEARNNINLRELDANLQTCVHYLTEAGALNVRHGAEGDTELTRAIKQGDMASALQLIQFYPAPEEAVLGERVGVAEEKDAGDDRGLPDETHRATVGRPSINERTNDGKNRENALDIALQKGMKIVVKKGDATAATARKENLDVIVALCSKGAWPTTDANVKALCKFLQENNKGDLAATVGLCLVGVNAKLAQLQAAKPPAKGVMAAISRAWNGRTNEGAGAGERVSASASASSTSSSSRTSVAGGGIGFGGFRG